MEGSNPWEVGVDVCPVKVKLEPEPVEISFPSLPEKTVFRKTVKPPPEFIDLTLSSDEEEEGPEPEANISEGRAHATEVTGSGGVGEMEIPTDSVQLEDNYSKTFTTSPGPGRRCN
jgi:hypothetical protein